MVKLGVNVDHVATLRQARGTDYPDPVKAAQVAIAAGATGITIHLREDRRHIQDHDVIRMLDAVDVPVNLEMAATEAMVAFAEQHKPQHVCLVPEKRAELTTEGGLNVVAQEAWIQQVCQRFANLKIEVSLFIDPSIEQIDAAVRVGAPVIELHTGTYADAKDISEQQQELQRLHKAAEYAHRQGLIVNAGHGLTVGNVQPVATLPFMNELNIGHGMVADSVFVGLGQATKMMLAAMKV